MSCLQVQTRRWPAGMPGCLMLLIFGCFVTTAFAQSEPAADKAPVVATGDKPVPTPPARPLRMPVKWLGAVGLDQLLSLE